MTLSDLMDTKIVRKYSPEELKSMSEDQIEALFDEAAEKSIILSGETVSGHLVPASAL